MGGWIHASGSRRERRGMSGLKGLRANPAALAACFVIAALVLFALVGPWLSPNDIETLDWANVARPPGAGGGHWFGTDRLGRDLYVRTLEGIRVSLLVGSCASLFSVVIGIAYGAVAGFVGGRTDDLMMRFIEVLSGLPLIFFVIFLSVVFGRSEYFLLLAIGAVGWLTMARIVRGQTLSIRRREYIEAAVASGATTARIIVKQVIPNLWGPVIVYATLTVPQIILFESFLSFLGLGIQEPHASLGTLIAEGAGEMEAAAWILWVPGTVLAALLLSLNLFGDGLRDAFDVTERRLE